MMLSLRDTPGEPLLVGQQSMMLSLLDNLMTRPQRLLQGMYVLHTDKHAYAYIHSLTCSFTAKCVVTKVHTDRSCCPSSQNAQIESLCLVQAVPAKQVSKSPGVNSTKLLMYNQQQTQGRGFAWAALRMRPDAVLVLTTASMSVALHAS